eukprot:gene8866-583_t
MSFCSVCGVKSTGAKFCTGCGQPVLLQPPAYAAGQQTAHTRVVAPTRFPPQSNGFNQNQPTVQQTTKVTVQTISPINDGEDKLDPFFTGFCCRCHWPIPAILGQACCWQPKVVPRPDLTYDFRSCLCKCICPMLAVVGQQGCVNKMDVFCAFVCQWPYTMLCWEPKLRDGTIATYGA